jgi:hypothetical protein
MKEKSILLLALLLLSMQRTNGQVSTLGNSGSGTDFVGWDQFQTNSLEIRHDAPNFPIEFYTNKPGASSPNTNMRMKIWHGNVLLPNGTTPFEVGRVGILNSWDGWSAYPDPVSLLHLGTGIDRNGNSGYRKWMDIGTFTNAGTDYTYFGLKHEPRGLGVGRNFSQYMDAVIGWGDNEDVLESFNDLRFIFTAKTTTSGDPLGTSYDGREIIRVCYTGNVGIGNFYIPGTTSPSFTPSSALRPARRLEVLDGGLIQPQLRLTHTQQNGVNTGIYTDFQSLSTGDLRINPKLNAGNRFVGINNASAITTTLQLGSNAANQSGLRFENVAKIG